MPSHKKWADAAEKQAAYRIHKEHPEWDDTQIRAYLHRSKSEPDPADRHNSVPSVKGNDPGPPQGSLDLALIESYIIRGLAGQVQTDPQLINTAFKLLDMKKKTGEISELAQKLTTEQLLAVIKPGKPSQPAPLPLTNTSPPLNSSTTSTPSK